MGREEDKLVRMIEDKFEALERGVLNEIKKKQEDILQSQEFLSKMYDDVLSIVKGVKSKHDALEIEVAALKKDSEAKDSTIANLQWRLSKVEQYSRKNNIEIREVPVQENENLEQVVVSVVGKVGVEITTNEIEVVHRIKVKEGKIPPILAKLKSRETVEDIFQKKKDVQIKKEDITGPGTGTDNIYIGKNLSPYFRNLFWKAKTAAKLANHKYVWMQGTVMIRKETGSKAYKIEHENDIIDFFKELNLDNLIEKWQRIINTPISLKNREETLVSL